MVRGDYEGDIWTEDLLERICRAILALPAPGGNPRPHDLLLDGLALLTTEGHAAAAPTLRRAAQTLVDIPVEDVLRWGWAANGVYYALWDFEGVLAISARQVQLVRDAGVLAQLADHLSAAAIAQAWTGDFAGAAVLIAASDSAAEATGSHIVAVRLIAAPGPAREGG